MLLLSFGTRELVSDKKDFSSGILRQIEVSSAGLACQRGLHYCWQVSLHQMPVSEVLLLLPLSKHIHSQMLLQVCLHLPAVPTDVEAWS